MLTDKKSDRREVHADIPLSSTRKTGTPSAYSAARKRCGNTNAPYGETMGKGADSESAAGVRLTAAGAEEGKGGADMNLAQGNSVPNGRAPPFSGHVLT